MMLDSLMKQLTAVGTFMIRESQEPGQQVISELLHANSVIGLREAALNGFLTLAVNER